MNKKTTRRIEVRLPEGLDDSLNALVTLSGLSKTALIHEALVAFLGPKGVLAPSDVEPVPLTITRGPRRHH